MRRSIFFRILCSRPNCSTRSRAVEARGELSIVRGMAQRYVSNKNESVRMFESGFMEFFSHVHPATPLVIYLPVVGWMIVQALQVRGMSFAAVAGFLMLGILIWTL